MSIGRLTWRPILAPPRRPAAPCKGAAPRSRAEMTRSAHTLLAAAVLLALAAPAQAAPPAPGAPGGRHTWTAADKHGFGTATQLGSRTWFTRRSATPLAWTHGQLIRLAWSIDAGEPIERPSIVACRYTGQGCG